MLNANDPFDQLLHTSGMLLDCDKNQLASFVWRLWQANQDLNLFSRRIQPEQLVTEHVLDCLAALPYFPKNRTLVDLGSGGGMPGVLLAIARPHAHVLLYEKSPLKCRFLQEQLLFVPNIQVEGPLLEVDWPRNAVVTARAFKPIATILKCTQQHLSRGGRYLLYKGRKEKIELELQEAEKWLVNKTVKLIPVKVPFEAERHLVEIY